MNHASSESDVLVIGGGPAGASIARLLALRGWHVVVVSRAIDGQRGLAETLPPSTRKVLAAVGLLEAVEQASAFRSIGNAVWWGSDDGRLEDFAGHDDRPGLQVWRPELDRLLQVEAVRAGVEWITGNVIGVELETSPVRVRVTRPDGSTLDRHASFVVDATGRTGVVARSARRTAGAPRTHAWIGLWTCPSKTTLAADVRTLVETTDEGWIWSVPAAPGTRCVAVMVDPDRTRFAADGRLERRYLGELSRSRHVRALLDDAHLQWVWGCDASLYETLTVGSRRHLVVGDAASFIDPLSSFGVKKALTSAWMGAAVVQTWLTDPAVGPAAQQLFDTREREAWTTSLRRSAGYAREALPAHDTPFWQVRCELDRAVPPQPAADPVPVPVPRIAQAFERLRHKDAVARRPDTRVWFEPQPAFERDRVVLAPALRSSALDAPVRIVDNVNLARLVALVRERRKVGDLFAGYCAQEVPVPLPAFLRALSVLVAGQVLEPVDG